MRRSQFIISLVFSSCLGGFIVLGTQHFLKKPPVYQSIEERQNLVLAANPLPEISPNVPEGLNFIFAANLARPAVVHVKTSHSGTVSQNDPLEDMFRHFHNDGYRRPYPRQSSGSGVIISDDGYIATNHHVIDDAGAIEVVLNDKRSYEAWVVGTDPSTDLALLKIEDRNLPFIRYGNSDELQIGEWVLAVGNPFDLTSTVTAGIVSATGRNINLLKDDEFAIESFIQTDAAVNPGNSGGALVNLKGELIGVNTAIATHTGYYAGFSFAVPISLVRKVMDDLKNYGEIQRALLGVKIREVDALLAREKELKDLFGVYVVETNRRGAAYEAGLREGDIILRVDDLAVNSTAELQTAVAMHRPGDRVEVVFFRKGKQKRLWVLLKNKKGSIGIIRKADTKRLIVLGAELEEISLPEKKRLRVDSGVKVIKVGKGKMKGTGMREGFIITRVDDKPVHSPQEVMDIIKESKRTIAIEGVYPNGNKDYYAIGW